MLHRTQWSATSDMRYLILLPKPPSGYWKWLVSCFWCRKQQLSNTWKKSLCFNASLSDSVSEVMRDKVFHLKHIFQCLEKQKYFMSPCYIFHTLIQHCRYNMVSTVCLACYLLFKEKNVLDVMQDKGLIQQTRQPLELCLLAIMQTRVAAI